MRSDRVIAEIDLREIKNNLLAIKKQLAHKVKIMSVLKANAYGHGAINVAKFTEHIIDYIAVATLEEGILLRRHGIIKPILVLGETDCYHLKLAQKYDIIITVFSKEIWEKYQEFVNKHSFSVKIHLKVDTGMNRIGIQFDDFDTINKIFTAQNFIIDGLYSHLARADDTNFTTKQRARFECVIDYLSDNNFSMPMCHLANSVGSRDEKNMFDCVRIGIEQFVPSQQHLRPAMTLKAKIVQIKDIATGESVGYDCAYTAEKNIRVATVAVGYADGLMRCLSNIGSVLIKGKICPIIGNVCMDFIMVDISEIAFVTIGDYAIIFGKDIITARNLAMIMGTIPYEIITHLSERVKKMYIP